MKRSSVMGCCLVTPAVWGLDGRLAKTEKSSLAQILCSSRRSLDANITESQQLISCPGSCNLCRHLSLHGTVSMNCVTGCPAPVEKDRGPSRPQSEYPSMPAHLCPFSSSVWGYKGWYSTKLPSEDMIKLGLLLSGGSPLSET